ncbi:MAG: hypothetical protein NT069_20060 [Planctomycetota bacterium]|nr:hypothetical protein [Planctomycetota bacterium]
MVASPKPPTWRVEQLVVRAESLVFLDAPLHVELTAAGLRYETSAGSDSATVDWRDGRLTLSMSRAELDELVLRTLRTLLQQHRVIVEGGHVTLAKTPTGELDVSLKMTGRRGIVSATIEASARVTLDEHLVLRFSNLRLVGRGVVGSVIARFLRKSFATLEHQPIELAGGLTEFVRLIDIDFDLTDPVRILGRLGPADSSQKGVRSGVAATTLSQTVVATRFDIYLIDTGEKPTIRELVDGSWALLHQSSKSHRFYTLSTQQSVDLLADYPEFRGTDPILLLLDGDVASDSGTVDYGYRFCFGHGANPIRISSELVRLVEILGDATVDSRVVLTQEIDRGVWRNASPIASTAPRQGGAS